MWNLGSGMKKRKILKMHCLHARVRWGILHRRDGYLLQPINKSADDNGVSQAVKII